MSRNLPEYRVVIPSGLAPEVHEVEIAQILANYFQCNVQSIKPSLGYKIKSADILAANVLWEIKSPKGSSMKSTIEKQFRGLRQSRNLVIDGRRTVISDTIIRRKIAYEMARRRTRPVPRKGRAVLMGSQRSIPLEFIKSPRHYVVVILLPGRLPGFIIETSSLSSPGE